jgi:hypothetical protein
LAAAAAPAKDEVGVGIADEVASADVGGTDDDNVDGGRANTSAAPRTQRPASKHASRNRASFQSRVASRGERRNDDNDDDDVEEENADNADGTADSDAGDEDLVKAGEVSVVSNEHQIATKRVLAIELSAS